MAVQSSQELETICDSIFSETSKDISWKWDRRFDALLSEFPCEEEEEVITILEKNFVTCWNKENISDAPLPIKNAANQLGDIREEQLLYSSDPSREVLVLGAYWPWNNGKKFSLRILMDILKIDLGPEASGESVGSNVNS